MTYDLFPFFNELDLLEIRLNILDPYVDFFVLMESRETFSGMRKPLHYQENKERFAKWGHKIIEVEMGMKNTKDSFERAFFQKEGLKAVLEHSLGVKDDDVIYYGDVDEIWTPQEVTDRVLSLRQLNYCYYMDLRSSEEWVGTIVGRWKEIKTNTLCHWRATHTNIVDGGWHFTNMGGMEQILKKLDAYDHQEMNTRENRVLLEDRMKSGEDYVGRGTDWQGHPFTFHRDDVDLPQFLLDSREKYKHLFI